MTKICDFIKTRTAAHWSLLFAFVAASVLAAVYISQHFGMHPCKLCLMQRVPYAAILVLSLLMLLSRKQPVLAEFLTAAIMITFAIGGAIALFHVGVEEQWWTFNSDCAGDVSKPGGSVSDFLAALKKAPIVRCDAKVPFLFGLTMAVYNTLLSAGMVVVAAIALCAQRSSSLSQYK